MPASINHCRAVSGETRSSRPSAATLPAAAYAVRSSTGSGREDATARPWRRIQLRAVGTDTPACAATSFTEAPLSSCMRTHSTSEMGPDVTPDIQSRNDIRSASWYLPSGNSPIRELRRTRRVASLSGVIVNGSQSSIEWTEATWNPTTGCNRTSPGCDHCYALTLAKLGESAEQLPTRTIELLERALDSAGLEIADIRTAAARIAPDVAKVVVRLYWQSDEATRARRLDVIDRLLVVGIRRRSRARGRTMMNIRPPSSRPPWPPEDATARVGQAIDALTGTGTAQADEMTRPDARDTRRHRWRQNITKGSPRDNLSGRDAADQGGSGQRRSLNPAASPNLVECLPSLCCASTATLDLDTRHSPEGAHALLRRVHADCEAPEEAGRSASVSGVVDTRRRAGDGSTVAFSFQSLIAAMVHSRARWRAGRRGTSLLAHGSQHERRVGPRSLS